MGLRLSCPIHGTASFLLDLTLFHIARDEGERLLGPVVSGMGSQRPGATGKPAGPAASGGGGGFPRPLQMLWAALASLEPGVSLSVTPGVSRLSLWAGSELCGSLPPSKSLPSLLQMQRRLKERVSRVLNAGAELVRKQHSAQHPGKASDEEAAPFVYLPG